MGIRDGRGKNVGDWSEIYVLFRIMERGRIQSADAEMHPVTAAYIPVLKVIREERTGQIIDYYTATGEGERRMQIYSGEKFMRNCTVKEFRNAADELLDALREAIAYKRTASMHFPNTEEFLDQIMVQAIKAPSKAISKMFGGKVDITMVVQQMDGTITPAGFSIKSSLSSPASLGNSSNACNFYYELPGCDDNLMDRVNAITTGAKIIRRARMIAESGIDPVFHGVGSTTYEKNLMLLGTDMSSIISRALWLAFSKSDGGRNSRKSMIAAIDELCEDDPSSAAADSPDYARIFYRKRLSDYLMAVACGMNPDEQWNGRNVIKGGYVFVTKGGDVLAYLAADEDLFRDFLVENVKFDSPSSSRRANDANGMSLGEIVKIKGSYYFTLNLQLRFTS